MQPEHPPVRCPHCQQTVHLPPHPEPGLLARLLRRRPGNRKPKIWTCPSCSRRAAWPDSGYAEAIPTDSGHPNLRGVTCGRCRTKMNYKPAHRGRTVPCTNCASLLVLP
ncbi:hypothetical protein EDC39_11123 [Geothermobacter ehrlichii]|uniref:Uncharacterized protein n=1 Tax=Geothermobacter ehrlichii TaxID=213224 RepID=A0A5D3WHQ3_9BACT|nr:hypothetical protein EDC39_11123 [Geothermobacter ehrlichii]